MNKRRVNLEKLYIVYFNALYEEVFICPNEFRAKQIIKAYERINKLTSRKQIKILSGPCSDVFSYKIPEFLNVVFVWDITSNEKQKIFDYITEIPMKAR